jgi:SAM-dependent methyltransferase
VTFALVCPRCGGAVSGDERGATCAAGHFAARLQTGFDFVGDAPGAHYPERGIARLERMEAEHFWFVVRRGIVLDAVRRARLARGSVFLDLGAGTGAMAAALARRGFRAIAADYHARAAEAVRRTGGAVPFHAVDIRALPFRGLDAVGLFDVIEHLDEPERALVEVRRALRPGGLLFATVPARPELWTPVDRHSGHRLRYDRPTLARQLRAGGFEPERITYFMMMLAAPLLVVRTFGRWRVEEDMPPERVDALFEDATTPPPALVNRLASAALSLERAWLRAGDLPYGSSLLAVARSAG